MFIPTSEGTAAAKSLQSYQADEQACVERLRWRVSGR